ncbi:hypothetical protein E8E13_010694 [Curvularia kusanoi]|uniref:Uncharacterized protein n=1 Tax=Curvularia kusanoi TaxID=90978 RepID=A0A9P4TIX9_CURKU|nr:hypothetical protein E8E13_010694 [Curvularia kusanoi]
MHASIELGRAVIATSAADLELWCKTLITISPQQQCTNFEQHSAVSLLELISSDKVWVGRGNGLHVDLNITFNGQPVGDAMLRRLSDSILGAPVWRQLHLQPAIPDERTLGPGKLRLLVNYAIGTAAVTAGPHKGILPDVPAAELQPPEGIYSLTLDSIEISADIFQPTPQRKFVRTKRPRTPKDLDVAWEARFSQPTGDASDAVTDAPSSGILEAVPLAPGRKRPIASTTERPNSSPAEPVSEKRTKTPPGQRRSKALGERQNPEPNLGCAGLRLLIDGALRLSVLSTISNKLFPDLKVKANTFELGLMDIAPCLWRPDYARTMLQRVQLLPVVARSISRPTSSMHIVSKSLQDKLSMLVRPSLSMSTTGQGQDLALTGEIAMATNIIPLLWQYLQRTIPRNPATLQSFVAANSLPTSTSESGQWSEVLLQKTWKDHTSRSGAVRPTVDEASYTHRIQEDDNAPQSTHDEAVFPECSPDTVADFGHVVKTIDDEMLLADAGVMFLAPTTHLSDEELQH